MKLNITNKLAIIIIGGIISLAVCLGIYFDNYLRETYFKEAKKKIEHSFSRLISEVQKIENNLKRNVGLTFLFVLPCDKINVVWNFVPNIL